jgi:hypothetical protein
MSFLDRCFLDPLRQCFSSSPSVSAVAALRAEYGSAPPQQFVLAAGLLIRTMQRGGHFPALKDCFEAMELSRAVQPRETGLNGLGFHELWPMFQQDTGATNVWVEKNSPEWRAWSTYFEKRRFTFQADEMKDRLRRILPCSHPDTFEAWEHRVRGATLSPTDLQEAS